MQFTCWQKFTVLSSPLYTVTFFFFIICLPVHSIVIAQFNKSSLYDTPEIDQENCEDQSDDTCYDSHDHMFWWIEKQGNATSDATQDHYDQANEIDNEIWKHQ